MKPENLRPNWEELRSGPNEVVQGMRKEHGGLPQGEFTGHSTPVPMASLSISDCKISDGKDCVFYLYIFFLPSYLSPHCTYHISSQNVSWINVELTKKQMNSKLCKQTE